MCENEREREKREEKIILSLSETTFFFDSILRNENSMRKIELTRHRKGERQREREKK